MYKHVEQQTVSNAKAGIMTTLNVCVSILAAALPVNAYEMPYVTP